jgi:transcriptional regulator with XRE-family HTH domain
MSESTIDVQKLVGVMDARIATEGMSWREAARQIGVSPSLLSRLRNDQRPDLDAYVMIVRWLGMSADDFLISDESTSRRTQPELTSEVAALLRARADLTDQDRALLESMFRSGLQHVRSTQAN